MKAIFLWYNGRLTTETKELFKVPLILFKNKKQNFGKVSYKVKVGDTTTKRKPVEAGVIQGSILGPILFLIFIADINEQFQKRAPKAASQNNCPKWLSSCFRTQQGDNGKILENFSPEKSGQRNPSQNSWKSTNPTHTACPMPNKLNQQPTRLSIAQHEKNNTSISSCTKKGVRRAINQNGSQQPVIQISLWIPT